MHVPLTHTSLDGQAATQTLLLQQPPLQSLPIPGTQMPEQV